MPAIIIKDYQWRQTEKKIIIYVLLKGRPKNVDLFAMDNYVKISFPPFILELFLWGNVLEEESECTLTDTEAIFSLQKANVASDWPTLEMEGISKEEKRHFRNCILEKIQNVLESRAKSRSEKRELLQKEAVKVQINLDTNTLNKIESLRDSSRKAAMQDFEEWRSKAEEPILQNISGKVQENRKEYRPPLKWFKDELGILKPYEINTKELNKNMQIEKKRRDESIDELTEEPSGKHLKGRLIVEESIKNEKKENSLFEEEKLKTEPIKVKENSKTDSIDKMNLKEDAVPDKNIKEKADCLNIKKTASSESFNLEEASSNSEDSESNCRSDCNSDCDRTPYKSSRPFVKEMDKNSLRNFYAKMRKLKPDNLIDTVLKNRHSRMNRIFDEPAKSRVPLPRKNGTINITFSERAFPTPARESSYVEEQEWLAKQAEARRKTGFVVEDLRPEEQDPQWLKDKGDDFFKAGNYLAAISAYSHGIKISEKMAALYLNRSAAHYAIGNYYRCIDDCSKVLELTEPKCESNRVSRARCYARRGAALCKLSAPQHGIPELEAALKLDPNNGSIKSDLEAAKQYFNIKE